MTPDAKIFHELWQSAERELAERPSQSAMVDLVAAIIQDETKYDPATNTWDVEKAAADIVNAMIQKVGSDDDISDVNPRENIIELAKDYLAKNAAESGADELIRMLVEECQRA